jgi:hypothetical protein
MVIDPGAQGVQFNGRSGFEPDRLHICHITAELFKMVRRSHPKNHPSVPGPGSVPSANPKI